MQFPATTPAYPGPQRGAAFLRGGPAAPFLCVQPAAQPPSLQAARGRHIAWPYPLCYAGARRRRQSQAPAACLPPRPCPVPKSRSRLLWLVTALSRTTPVTCTSARADGCLLFAKNTSQVKVRAVTHWRQCQGVRPLSAASVNMRRRIALTA